MCFLMECVWKLSMLISSCLLEYFELPFWGADIVPVLKKYSSCTKENVLWRFVELGLVETSSWKDLWVWLCDSNSCREEGEVFEGLCCLLKTAFHRD